MYSDPFTPGLVFDDQQYKSQNLTPTLLEECTCALILTAHSDFVYEMIVRHAPLILDTRNGTRHVNGVKAHVILLS